MTPAAAQLPGVSFTRAARAVDPAPLRSDVAGFAGRTLRGPVGQRVRVEGWNDYVRWFGGLAPGAYLPYCLRGYFENGGQVAHVVRVGAAAQARAAHADWPLAQAGGLQLRASSPGTWANRTRVHARYRRSGRSGRSELDLAIETPGEPAEYLSGLLLQASADDALPAQVERRSLLLRLRTLGGVVLAVQHGASEQEWHGTLADGTDPPLQADSYAAALTLLQDEGEVALVGLPDLHQDLAAAGTDAPGAAQSLLADLVAQMDDCRDRLLLVDAPLDAATGAPMRIDTFLDWLRGLRGDPPARTTRAAAAYHPWLQVQDPLGGVVQPLKTVPPSGHVAGVVSRLDRERGAHYTPANASLLDAVDLGVVMTADEQLQLHTQAVNLLRCSPGRGLQLWGGSTLWRAPGGAAATDPDQFIACRRLVHRLVRAIRRVAEPLVFATNGPELWLALVRAVTTVLLEAWRGGALHGSRPDEAFYVRCDDSTNPPDQRELGRCICEIGVAPVAPMEFIVFRVALNGEAPLEVFES